MPQPHAHLHYGICRRCYGTGDVVRMDDTRGACPVCEGRGALA